jgi:RND family efflux transporter MFP subunit
LKNPHAIALVSCALALVAGCKRAEPPPAEEIRPVRIITIEPRRTGETVSLTGTVQAQNEVKYSFRIDGRLAGRAVNVGDEVRPGQLIAQLDASNEQSSLQSALAERDAARARLVEQRNSHARQKDMLAKGFVSRAAFEQAEASLQSAESALKTAQSKLEQSQNRLSYTRLVAGGGGVVAAVGAEPGEVVTAGRTVVQVLQKGGRDAVFDVPARWRDAGPRNPDIVVALTSNAKVAAKARVREVSPQADPSSGTFRVRVALIDPPQAMGLGSTVTGSVRVDREQGIDIPASALVRSGAQTAVWIFDPKAGSVALRPVEIASHESDRVVVAAGLDAGDMVVSAGVHALHPGQKVRPLGPAR